MNHLLGRTKGRDGEYYKLVSNETVYTLPNDLNNAVPYAPGYILDEDQWFAIDDFNDQSFSLPILSEPFTSTHFAQMPAVDRNRIAHLLFYESGQEDFFFQKVTPSQIIRKKWFSLNDLSFQDDRSILTINNKSDAIYRSSENRLYFKKLTSISTIFNGINSLYREATQSETSDFLNSEFISLGDDFGADNVKKANRKRIAMAMDTLNALSNPEKTSIINYVREYCSDLPFDTATNSFEIENESGLKELLYGIEQRYYTTLIGNEKRLANSVRVIS